MGKVNGIDLIVILIYCALLVVIGIVYSKRVSSAKDFTSAGQKMTLPVVVGSTIATCLGISILFSNYERIHTYGLAGLVWAFSWYFGWLLLIPLAKKVRATTATSLPGYLELRYGTATRKISSWFVLVSCIGLSSSLFLAIGNTTVSLGICDVTTGTIVGALIIVLFTVFSGLWGVAITDTIQTVILFVGCVIIIPIMVFKNAGGLSYVIQNTPADTFDITKGMPITLLIGYCMNNFLSAGADASYMQRSFAAVDNKTAMRGQLYACLICAFICIVACIPAFAIPFLYPDMTGGAQFIPTFIADYFPPIATGMMLSVVLGLLLTTGDTSLMLVSSTIVDDFIRPAKPEINDKKLLWMGRMAIVVSAVLMVVLALYIRSILELFVLGGSAYSAAVFVPLHLGAWWKKANTRAVNIAMIAGGGTSLVWDLTLMSSTGIRGIMVGIAMNAIISVAGSIFLNHKENRLAVKAE